MNLFYKKSKPKKKTTFFFRWGVGGGGGGGTRASFYIESESKKKWVLGGVMGVGGWGLEQVDSFSKNPNLKIIFFTKSQNRKYKKIGCWRGGVMWAGGGAGVSDFFSLRIQI